MSSYWDLADILSDNQRILCSFNDPVPGYGFLSRTSELTLLPNVNVEIPFYKAEHLADQLLIDMKEPACFTSRVREDLDASAIAVNLHALSPSFYAFGAKILNVIEDEKLPEILINTFKSRLKTISDYTQTSKLIIDRFTFIDSLDDIEKEIYKKGYESEVSTMKWINKATGNKLN